MGGVRTPSDPGETPRLRRGLENNAGCILQLIHPHPCSSEMIPGSPAGMSPARRGPGIRGAMGVISRRTFCQRRDVAEGLGSWEQRPSLSGALGGEKPWCQPHSCCAWPGRGDWIWGNTAPMALKRECPTKAIPMEVCRIGSWAGSVVVQQGPKSQSAHFPNHRLGPEGRDLARPPPASIYPGISRPNSAGAPGQGICLWNETG